MPQYITNKGITIIENLVTILLIVIATSASLFAFNQAQRCAALSRHHYRAVSFAREALERILANQDPLEGQRILDPTTGLAGTLIDNSVGQTIEITVTWTENIMAANEARRSETIVYLR